MENDSCGLPGCPGGTEQWKPVPGYDGAYEVSDHGRVRSLARSVERSNGRTMRLQARILLARPAANGYPRVTLYSSNQATPPAERNMHNLVLTTFTGPAPDGWWGLHGDGEPLNNHVANLRWAPPRDNMFDTIRHGRHRPTNKSHCLRGHLLAGPNLMPSTLAKGRRACLACNRAKSREWHARQAGRSFDIQKESDSIYADIKLTA